MPRTAGLPIALLLAVATALSGPALAGAGRSAGRAAAGDSSPLIAILCYHEIDDRREAPATAVPAAFLRDQIRASKRDGWTFLSLPELLARRDRPEQLPPRVMVLTFDDGYRSFVEGALPILREEGVPATIAVVTSWVDRPPPGRGLPPLMTWAQIREARRSGLVEVASHSHDLHRYVTSNPYRDTAPALATRRYLLDEVRYEDRDEYRARIREDLAASKRRLDAELEAPVPVLAWPYGHHNAMARELARAAGFTVTLALGGRPVEREDLRSGCLPRVMVNRRMDFTSRDLAWLMPPAAAIRAAQVDLDAMYDPDPGIYERRLQRMVARVTASGATHVFLQACPDPDGNGRLRQAWFVNHQVPVRADIWSMAAARFSHAGLRVWLRAPAMNLTWVWEARPEWRIPFQPTRARGEKTPWYYRVSPDLPQVWRAAIDFYTDAAVYLPIDGVLFDDDAYMLPGERLNVSHAADPQAKARAIDGLLAEIRRAVRAWRPDCRFGRNLYAPVVERGGLHPDFCQDLTAALRDGDLAVVMAYARMEGHARDADRWIASLARRALRMAARADASAAGPRPVMFKLQAYDWTLERWVPEAELLAQVRAARREGIVHLGVYPLDPEQGEIPDRLLEGGVVGAAAGRPPGPSGAPGR